MIELCPNFTYRNVSDDLENSFSNLLHRIYTCRLRQMDLLTLKHRFVTNWFHSHSFVNYTYCLGSLESREPSDDLRTSNNSVHKCIPHVLRHCWKSSARVIKTIRQPMYLIRRYINEDPELKVILLIRDPRGILNSRRKVRGFPATPQAVKKICAIQRRDWLTAQKLLSEFLNNIKIVKYENLARDTMGTMEDLYKFIGLSPSQRITKWISKSTREPPPVIDLYSRWNTQRNSSAVVGSWREELPSISKAYFDQYCEDTLQLLGYSS